MQNRRAREPFFSPRRAGCEFIADAPASAAAMPFTYDVPPARAVDAVPLLSPAAHPLRAIPVEHEADSGLDRFVGRIQDHGVGRGCERGNLPACIACVALLDVAQKTVNCTVDSFFDQLVMAAPRPFLGACRDEDLEDGVGKHD